MVAVIANETARLVTCEVYFVSSDMRVPGDQQAGTGARRDSCMSIVQLRCRIKPMDQALGAMARCGHWHQDSGPEAILVDLLTQVERFSERVDG
jgi:hypothetical protein